jgi:hypothetical protein
LKQQEMADVTIKERFSALNNLPRFFKLVWQTSPSLTLTNALLRITRSALPVAILYVGKLIIDQVVLLSHGSGGEYYHLWKLVAIEFLLAILSDGLSRATTLVDSLLGDLFSNHTSIQIMEHEATLDLDQFEDSEFYDKLERARSESIYLLHFNAAWHRLADILVQRLPGKYEQALGKRFNNGVELSGGEWQKIALARAYMKNAQLLILDERTSTLDARAEYEVFQRLAELKKGKTAVLISHRFSTVRMADRILF